MAFPSFLSEHFGGELGQRKLTVRQSPIIVDLDVQHVVRHAIVSFLRVRRAAITAKVPIVVAVGAKHGRSLSEALRWFGDWWRERG